jgi:Dyp-type peroxidase family
LTHSVSHAAIAKLLSKAEADLFGDEAFRIGLAERSSYLGDPTDSASTGNVRNWKVGGPKTTADIIVIVAADDVQRLDDVVALAASKARDLDLEVLFEQRGDDLPAALSGHEHFGFKDGISQPGVRGKASTVPGDYITPRYIDFTDERAKYMAKPGQLLAWPGQFLFGELRQNTEYLHNSAPAATNFPAWASRGSYLVVRRLHQDVLAFWEFVTKVASGLGMDPTHVAALLVGRWPSGAPLMRSPAVDNPALGNDQFANNHFIFDDNTRPVALRPIPGYPGDAFPPATADFLATVCPHFAHIRKVNPRDTMTDLGKPHDNLLRMILRRGIPYGPPIVGVKKPPPELIKKERGLMFLCYGSSIQDQFEFLQRRWANSPIQPNFGGHDPVIGQSHRGNTRTRFIDVPSAGGPVRIKISDEWVIPTGGGYFVAPPIRAIAGVLGT